jgi:hypothetical protein
MTDAHKGISFITAYFRLPSLVSFHSHNSSFCQNGVQYTDTLLYRQFYFDGREDLYDVGLPINCVEKIPRLC